MGRGLPEFQCHKIVRAAKVARVEPCLKSDDGEKIRSMVPKHAVYFEDEDIAPVQIDHQFFNRHSPLPGGYYVEYDDGYASWSPAEAFEKGYSKLGMEPTITITQRQLEFAINHLGVDASLSVPDDELAKALIELMRDDLANAKD